MQHHAPQHHGGQHHQPEHLRRTGGERGGSTSPDLAENPDQAGADQGVGDQHHAPQQHGMATRRREGEQFAQGGEAGERRQAHQASRADEEGDADQGPLAPEPPQLGEVLGDVADHDRADRHQQQGHRQRIHQQQVVGHGRAAQAHGHEEQPQPAAHQKRKSPLDVHLGQGDQGCHHGGGATHHHKHRLHEGTELQQGLQPQQHPGATHHHHGIAQHGGRQGALHRLIEPEVQGNLGALAHRAGDQGQQDQLEARWQGGAVVGEVGGPALQAMEVPGAAHRQQGDHPSQQDQVANALGEKGIAGPLHHQGLVVPGAHDQVGAQGEQLEDHVAEEHRIGEHQGAEARLEEAEGAEEAGPAPVHFHVADGIDLHQQVQARDHRHGDQGGFGHQPVESDPQATRVEPGPAEADRPVEGLGSGGGIGVQGGKRHQAVAKGHRHHQQIEVTAGPRAGAGDQPRRPGQRGHGRRQGIERN